jgi:hypothetical protein
MNCNNNKIEMTSEELEAFVRKVKSDTCKQVAKLLVSDKTLDHKDLNVEWNVAKKHLAGWVAAYGELAFVDLLKYVGEESA